MKKGLIIAAVFLTIVGIGSIVAYKMYNKPHRDVNSEDAVFKVSVSDLTKEFREDETAANAKYLDKLIEVNGTIAEISKDQDGQLSVLISNDGDIAGVLCTMNKDQFTDSKVGNSIVVKGICSGILMDVALINCVFVK